MFRSVYQCANRLGQSLSGQLEAGVLPQVLRLQPAESTFVRNLFLSSPRCDDQKRQKPRKDKVVDANREVSNEVKQAAVQAAKSLPGDWTKTAEELVARLQMKGSSQTQESDVREPPTGGARSLLSSMKVGRSFEPSSRPDRKRIGRRTQRGDTDEIFSESFIQKTSAQGRERRRTPVFNNLYGVPRLGIFNIKQTDKSASGQVDCDDDLWAQVKREHLRKIQGGLPRNAFEEMIRLTDQGKVWTFPIDNEADLEEERKYKFHDHVFLDRHLTAFPPTGPIRKFMELVTLGLSQNPWLTVPDKLEHIAWFESYFKEKQEVLEASLGEQGKMAEMK